MSKIVIDSNNKRLSLNLSEIKNYKDLFLILAYRDIRVRYAQTYLGLIWAAFQPIATLLIFVLIFGKAINVDTGSVPYPLFALSGISAWTLFSFVVGQSGQSLVAAQNMVKKIYFPRVIIPVSKAFVGLVDYAVVIFLLVVLMIYYDNPIKSNLLLIPVFILANIIVSLGVGIWVSALTVRFRDFQHIIPFVLQFGLYATPVAFPASLITERLPKWIGAAYYINPMVGVIEGARWSFFGTEQPHIFSFISFGIGIILFVSGLFYFRKVEKVMPDIL